VAWYAGNSVQQTTDGGYIVAGTIHSYVAGDADFALLKTDAFGSGIWFKTFGTPNLDFGKSVQQTSDGGCILTGYSHPNGEGNCDVWLIKTGANGE